MANIKGGKIVGTDDYINIENELNLNLTTNSIYQIQIQGSAVICEKATKPENNEGFFYNNFKPFGYKKESSFLWLRVAEGSAVFVNIAE